MNAAPAVCVLIAGAHNHRAARHWANYGQQVNAAPAKYMHTLWPVVQGCKAFALGQHFSKLLNICVFHAMADTIPR